MITLTRLELKRVLAIHKAKVRGGICHRGDRGLQGNPLAPRSRRHRVVQKTHGAQDRTQASQKRCCLTGYPKRMTLTPFFEGAMPRRRTRGLWSSPKRSRFRAPWRVSTKHCRSLLLRSNSRPERVYILRSKSSVSPFLAKLSARPMILELDTLAILIPMRLG